jgi:hypothetical protein
MMLAAALGNAPTRRRGRSTPATAWTSASAARSWPSTASAWRRSTSPAGVSVTPRASRASSRVPSWRSRRAICCEIAGCVKESATAASENDPRVATSRKTESSRASNITRRYQFKKARSLEFIAAREDHRPMTSSADLTLRGATAADDAGLARLAALDSSRVPAGELLVAELDGTLVAAMSIDTGAVIGDPFEHTAAIVESLRIRAGRRDRPAAAPVRLRRLLLGRA